MIICIYGKSGSGKSFLSKKLHKDLQNSIHIDLDKLNKDLIKLDHVKIQAKLIFKDLDILSNNEIDNKKLLPLLINNKDLHKKWSNYMLAICNDFVKNYIAKTNFDFYILDHLRANTLNVCKNSALFIECISSNSLRLKRLKSRDHHITQEILSFRDEYYKHTPSEITYNDKNYEEILSYIKTKNALI